MKWFQHIFNIFSGRYVQLIDEANINLYKSVLELKNRTINGDPGWMLERKSGKKKFNCDCEEA